MLISSSHAQWIKPNVINFQTNHTYELVLQNHSVIEASLDKSNIVPQIEYNFTKVSDIQNVGDKEKIDVLVICTQVGACVKQTTRSGRDTMKREVQVSDDSQTEIMLTFWGDKAEQFDQTAIQGKILGM